MTLKAFIAAVRRYRWTFLLVAGAVFIVAVTTILLTPAAFVSSTRLMLSVEGTTTAAAYQNEEVAARRVNTYIPLLTSGVVTQRVIDKLELPLTPSELADEIDVANVPPKTSLIDIEVTDRSPDRAREIADTLASEFISYAGSLETPTGEDNHKINTTVVTAAAEGRNNPFEPVVLGVLAGAAALLLGAAAVWIRATRAPAQPPAEPERNADDGDDAGDDTKPIETSAPISLNGAGKHTAPSKTDTANSAETVAATEPETAATTERVTAD